MATYPNSLSALTYLYTDENSVVGLLSQFGLDSRVSDDPSVIGSTSSSNYVQWAINWGTARVNTFASSRYDTSLLGTSWTVWQWATVLACYWLCNRRLNPVPDSLLALYEETMGELNMVKAGQLNIDDLPMRSVMAPVWSAIRMDERYIVRKMRVVGPLSDSTPTRAPQNQDLLADILPEPPIV